MEHDHLSHYLHDERPWGNFEQFTHDDISTVKLIEVKSGEAFSLQTHAHRDEFWRILRGSGTVTIGEHSSPAQPGDEFFVPRTVQHRAEGGLDGLFFLEIALGDFDEKDIVRIEDKYGRTSNN